MGCLRFDSLQNGGEQGIMTLLMIVLLLGIMLINYFFWIVIRMSSCLFSPKLRLLKCCLYNMVACNVVAGCITLPNHIFLFTRDVWDLDSGVCQFATIMDSIAKTTQMNTLLLCALDRMASQKFPSRYDLLIKRKLLTRLSVISTWVAAIIFSLPETVYIFCNEDLTSQSDCDKGEINHGICGFYIEAGIPVYQFVVLYVMPTSISLTFLALVHYEKLVPPATHPDSSSSGNNPENTSDEPCYAENRGSDSDICEDEPECHYNQPAFARVYGSGNKDLNQSQLSCSSSSSFEVNDQAEFQRTNIDLINSLPAADTKMSALPHIDSTFRLQQLRLLLESRASTLGEEGGRMTPVEAWSDYSADPHNFARHSSNSMYTRCQSSPLALGNCNLSLSSPPPQPFAESSETGFGTAIYGPVSHRVPVTKQDPNRMGRYRAAVTPVEVFDRDRSYCFSPPAVLSQGQIEADELPPVKRDLRGKQKHARLRKKWKVRKLEMSTLPPIQRQNDTDQGETTSISGNMYDQTLPAFEKTTVKVITVHTILFTALWLPFHLVSLVLSGCVGCEMPVSVWLTLKCLSYLAPVLSPLAYCFYHPVLNHSVKFILKIFKTETTKRSANPNSRIPTNKNSWKYPQNNETDC